MLKKSLYLSFAISFLAACSSSSNDSQPVDNTAPTVVFISPEDGTILSSKASIGVQYSEDIDINSLSFSGDLAADIGKTVLTGQGNNLKNRLTISPSAQWSGGESKTLFINASDPAGNAAPELALNFKVALTFIADQPASVIIGQSSATDKTSPTLATAANLKAPFGNPTLLGDYLYLADSGHHRLKGYLGIPVGNDDALFFLGQSSATDSAPGPLNDQLNLPGSIVKGLSQYFIVDTNNHRIMVFNNQPTATGTAADHDLGEAGLALCDQDHLNIPLGITVIDDKLVVADSGNNRVLFWQLPIAVDQKPYAQLGQPNMNNCNANRGIAPDKNTLANPTAVLSDGEHFIISDTDNNRVLAWLDFPIAENGSAVSADFVIGQEDFTRNGLTSPPTENSLNAPAGGMNFSGSQICITDTGNNRVLIWNSLYDTINKKPFAPLMVLGQATMESAVAATTAKGLSKPSGCTFADNQLIVTDTDNNRVVIYNAL